MLGVEELYRAYHKDLYRYLAGLTHDAAFAEDLLSETFLRALQSLHRYQEGRENERAWLFGIARNCWLQELRKQRRGRTVSLDADDGLLELYLPDGMKPLAEAAGDRALLRRIAELLSTRDERTQAVVRCRAQGLPYNDIAARLGISAGSARVIDCRARQWLREQLKKEDFLE